MFGALVDSGEWSDFADSGGELNVNGKGEFMQFARPRPESFCGSSARHSSFHFLDDDLKSPHLPFPRFAENLKMPMLQFLTCSLFPEGRKQ